MDILICSVEQKILQRYYHPYFRMFYLGNVFIKLYVTETCRKSFQGDDQI